MEKIRILIKSCFPEYIIKHLFEERLKKYNFVYKKINKSICENYYDLYFDEIDKKIVNELKYGENWYVSGIIIPKGL